MYIYFQYLLNEFSKKLNNDCFTFYQIYNLCFIKFKMYNVKINDLFRSEDVCHFCIYRF